MRIGAKIISIAVLPIVLTTAGILGIALYQKGALQRYFSGSIEEQARNEARKVAQNVYLMCRSAQESVQKTVDAGLRVAEYVQADAGAVSFSRETVAWTAVNQFTREKKAVVLPKMLLGGEWLGQNRNQRRKSPVVDEVKRLVGGTATIFQRMNDAGDMLRVVTNVENRDGSRAIGTYIPALEPDGRSNPVVAALLRGETFRGRAYVVNDWYITAYEPIWDVRKQRVVGALYVGVKQENLESLREGIKDIVVGKSGYVFVVGGKGDQRGRYIISRKGRRDGENVWDTTTADGRTIAQAIISKALALKNDPSRGFIDTGYEHYLWQNPEDPGPRDKTVAIAYFEPWDWVIGAGFYDSDFADSRMRMAEALNSMAAWVAMAALIMILLALPAGYLVARGIRSRVDSILKSVTDVLIVTDTHDRVIMLSQAAEKLFSTPFKGMRGRPLSEIVRDGAQCEKIAAALKQRKSGVSFDFELPGSDLSRQRIMSGRTMTIESAGRDLMGMITIIHDVTGEREVERMKSEFISTAAHELSTPLTTIVGYSELLLEQSGCASDRCREALTYINTKGWALSRIVDEILNVSRIESGLGIPMHLEMCDINEIVRQTVIGTGNISDRHTFELRIPETTVGLMVDEGKIVQVIENILSNGIKYSPAGGPIIVRGEIAAGCYRLDIIDCGIGMTHEQVEKIYEKFYRVDNSDTAVSGTGLGMSIVKHFVEAHGGRVWVESEPGRGTTVSFTLPLAG